MARSSSFLGDMKGKVALITGGSSGIGAAAAVEFAKQGCRVALLGRNENRLKQTIQQCQEAGSKPQDLLYVLADLTDESAVDSAVQHVLQEFGTVHFLVNNGGSAIPKGEGRIDDHTLDDFNYMMKLHVSAPFQLIKLLKPHLIKNKGSIVNVSSDCAHTPDPTMFGYSVAKSGLSGLTRSVALEFASQGVRCNAISPCWVRTPFMKNSGFMDDKEEALKYIDSVVRFIPQKHIPEPPEVARLIVFLASDCCHYLTGQDIGVDGCSTIASIATCTYMTTQ